MQNKYSDLGPEHKYKLLFVHSILKSTDALGANILSVEYNHIFRVITKDTGGLVFFQNNGGTIHVDFQREIGRAHV